MLTGKLLLLSIIFVPTLGAFLLPLIGMASKSARNFCALIMALVPFICSCMITPYVLSGHCVDIHRVLPLGFNFTFHADGLAVFMALVSSLISSIIVFYSFSYIDHYENQNEYYLMVILFLGAMMGLVYSGNLVFLYLFWEITAIVCWRLIGFFREKSYVLKADKAFLITVFGAVVMLIGFIILYQQTGSFDLLTIKEAFKNNPIPSIAVLLILAGILSKSATLPFQTWLPDAGVAPSPVTALLHAAVLVKIGVYVYARLFVATFPIAVIWQIAVPIIAGASALIAAGAALKDTDLKRIIAYSTISQIGFIFLGLSIGSTIALSGALLYILMHGLAKGGLFLCAGIVEQNTKQRDITKLGGLFQSMPITAVSFLFCAFSIMGIPPLGGFFSKYLLLTGAIATGNIFTALIFLFAAFLTILYLFRVSNAVFFGTPKASLVKEGSSVMVASVALLALLSLAAGIFIYYPAEMTKLVINQIFLGAVK